MQSFNLIGFRIKEEGETHDREKLGVRVQLRMKGLKEIIAH
jgi:hypothetical protein